MPLKQPLEETGDADAFNEEKKRKEKDENFFHGKPPLKIKMSGIFFSIQWNVWEMGKEFRFLILI